MAEKGRGSDHTSFLNNLLMLREQEIRVLSQKLHYQAALDSDGGSGISEGSLGSPEPQNLSLSPFRAISPEVTCPPATATTQEGSSHYNDKQAQTSSSNTLSQTFTQDMMHTRHSTEQRPSSHSLHPLQSHGVHSFNQRRHDASVENRNYWEDRSQVDNRQEMSRGFKGQDDASSSMLNKCLYEEEQKRQQAALATQVLESLATQSSTHNPLLPYSSPHNENIVANTVGGSSLLVRALTSSAPRKARGEKKPIPETLKDEKYFERRKRNNMAAKKSRDARKQREDQIAFRASYLEKENSILRAQVATLRDEASSLRTLLLQKKQK